MESLIATFIWVPFGYGCFLAWGAITDDTPEVPRWKVWLAAGGCFAVTLVLARLMRL